MGVLQCRMYLCVTVWKQLGTSTSVYMYEHWAVCEGIFMYLVYM